MAHFIVHRCSDHLFDAEGYERTAELRRSMKPRADGYYVLVDRANGTESQAADAVVAGPFVRLRNAQEAAAEIERAMAIRTPAMPLKSAQVT